LWADSGGSEELQKPWNAYTRIKKAEFMPKAGTLLLYLQIGGE